MVEVSHGDLGWYLAFLQLQRLEVAAGPHWLWWGWVGRMVGSQEELRGLGSMKSNTCGVKTSEIFGGFSLGNWGREKG